MNKTVSQLALTVSMVLAITFTFSCSSDDDGGGNPSSSSSGGGNGGGSACSADFRTVTIGTQTWMAENLNCDVVGSKCYNNNPDNCTIYGRLYDWSTAMKSCPSGWHLPTQEEWNTLSNYVESNSGCSNCDAVRLKATSGWSVNYGTDDYGFSALPGGFGNSNGNTYDFRNEGYWWSASEFKNGYAYYRLIYYNSDYVLSREGFKSSLYSVRCIKN